MLTTSSRSSTRCSAGSRSRACPSPKRRELFGFSRPAFYHALEVFQNEGLPGLIRKRPGPRRAHKLSEKVLQYIDALRAEDENLTAADLAAKVRRKFRVVIHPRSIERALQRDEKKGADRSLGSGQRRTGCGNVDDPL